MLPTTPDPKIKALASAILTKESGGNYQAKGASGEFGAYQFMPGTWKAWAGKHLGDMNAEPTVENQNKVAYSQIKEWKDHGLTPAQIASKWNSGNENAYKQNHRGVNSLGVAYDTPKYAMDVSNIYRKKLAQYAPPQQPAIQEPKQPLGEFGKVAGGVADFLGTGTLGKALGGAAATLNGTSAMAEGARQENAQANQTLASLLNKPGVSEIQKEHIRKQLSQGQEIAPELGAEQAVPEINYTPKQIYGSAAQTAALALPGSIGRAGEAAGLGEKVARVAGAGLLTGGILGAGKAAENNQSAGDIAIGGVKGALIGGAVGSAGELAAQGLGRLAESSAGRLGSSALKETIGETKNTAMRNGETLGQEAARRGHFGTDNQLFSKGEKGLQDSENTLQQILKTSKGTIKKGQLKPYFEDLIKEKQGTPGLGSEVDKIKKVYKEIPNEMTVQEANKQKRNLYKALNDKAYAMNADLSTTRDAQKALARGLKSEIEKVAEKESPGGGARVVQLNKDLSYYGKLKKSTLDNIVRKNRNQIFGFGDSAASIAGATIGGGPGAAAGLAVRHLAGSTLAKTAGAALLNRISKILLNVEPAIAEKVVMKIENISPTKLSGKNDVELKNFLLDLADFKRDNGSYSYKVPQFKNLNKP